MSIFTSASPQVYLLGTDDQSGSTIYPSSPSVPQHLPLFYIFAKKGTTNREVLTNSQMKELYDIDSFDSTLKWYNHQTRYLVAIQAKGNNCMVQRLIPTDAGIRANCVIYADLIETELPNYKRMADGSIVIDDDTGSYVVDDTNPTITGYRIKYIQEALDEDVDAGELKTKKGTMSITATTANKEVTPYTSLRINNVVTKIKVGDEYSLDITTDADTYTITTSDDGVVSIDRTSGAITGVAEGTATITVTASKDGYKDSSISHIFNVVSADSEVLNAANLDIIGIVEKFTSDTTTTTISNSDSDVAIEISSSDTSVISVNGRILTGVTEGSSVISVKAPFTSDYETVTTYFVLQYDDAVYTTTETRSIMYPLFEVKAKYQGEWYNNIGWTISSLTGDNADSNIISETLSLPYTLSFYTRTDSSSSPKVLRSLYGDPSVTFSFKEDAVNPNTEAQINLEHIYQNNWYNETDTVKKLRYEDLSDFYFYRDNFETIIKKVLETEKAYVSTEEVEWDDGEYSATTEWYDFTTSDSTEIDEEYYLINPISCATTTKVPYFTLMSADSSGDDGLTHSQTDTQAEVIFSTDSPFFLSGGSDGTMDNDMFESLVVEKIQDYSDTDSEVHDLAINVESVFYDSGFTLATKKELIAFITERKDTALILSTHDASLGESYASLTDSRAIGEALKTRCQLAPESEYFGTPVCRAMIMVGSAKLRDSELADRVPFTYEIALKAAEMMGDSDGNWNGDKLFDAYPNNVLTYMIDPQPAFIPTSVKPVLWAGGLVWCQPYDRANYFFPALQTVYEDETSVLNSYFNMMCIGQLSKAGDRTWRRFTGTTTLTNAEFIDAVTNFMNEDLKDRFAGLITVVPYCEITDEDENLGYSWRTRYEMYANKMKTVSVSYTVAYDANDLTSSDS